MTVVWYDAAWDAVIQARMSATLLLSGWFLYLLLRRFMACRRQAMVVAAVYGGLLLTLYWIPWEMESSTAFLLALLAAVAVALFESPRQKWLLMVFLCVAFFALRQVAASVGGAAYSSVYAGLVFAVIEPDQQFVGFLAASGVQLTVTSVLLGTAVQALQRKWPQSRPVLSQREFALLILPPAATLAVSLALAFFRQIIDYGTEYVRVEWLAAVLLGIQFAVILGTTAQFARMVEAQLRSEQQSNRNVEALALRRHLEDLETLYAGIRRFRHDANHHLAVLQSLEEAGEAAPAAAYVRTAEARLDDLLPEVTTGNPVSDVILASQKQQAERDGTAFRCQFGWPEGASFDAFDIGIILSNAGANALAGASGLSDAWVEVRSFRRRSTFVIEYVNRFAGTLRIDPQSGRPTTTKSEAEDHGLGLANVWSVAERYGGFCEIQAEDGICRLTVLLVQSQDASAS